MTTADAYQDFLKAKTHFVHDQGFSITRADIRPLASPHAWKPHQQDIVCWALRRGRAAIFAAYGLGKTLIQLELLRQIGVREGGRQLIVAPLGVRQEFKRDADKLGMTLTFVRRSAEVKGDGIYVTNYEPVRDGKLETTLFNAVSLDEAAVLRSYGSETYQRFLTLFPDVPYRFVATATPNPNRYKELIHYAGFLGIMDTGQALTRFFQRNSERANDLNLYPHMEAEFFVWLHSWAIFLQVPSDLGYPDDGYALTPLKVVYHEVPTPQLTKGWERDGQGKLITDAAISLKDAATEKRESIQVRVQKLKEILAADPGEHYLLWHHLEAERHAIKRAVPSAVEVYGSLDLDLREQRTLDFSDGKIQYLASKPEISGVGCNFQRYCHKAIFLGINYSFHDIAQAIHRIHRFLQDKPVEIHIIYTETEREVLKTLQEKWQEDEQLRERMSDIIREHGLSTTGLEAGLQRSIGCEREVTTGDSYTLVHADCVEEAATMPDNSVDMILTSIPFGNHYEYVDSYNDFGHNPDHEQFFAQMDYLTPELLRIIRPGRIAAIHVKDRVRFGNVTGDGFPTREPFHADCIYHFRKHGWRYVDMITVVTDVVRENNQTYRLGWTEQGKDGTKMGTGSPEYILLFRKLPSDTSRGYADMPVVKSKETYSRSRWQIDAHAFWRSNGNRFLTREEIQSYSVEQIMAFWQQYDATHLYDYHAHVKAGEDMDADHRLPAAFMALPPQSVHPDVWSDIIRMRTLNSAQASKRLQLHVCPLQLDLVERLITRYTNPGETILDPFAGLGTVPYVSVKMGRNGYGIELSNVSYRDSQRYLREAELERNMPTLFDMEEITP